MLPQTGDISRSHAPVVVAGLLLQNFDFAVIRRQGDADFLPPVEELYDVFDWMAHRSEGSGAGVLCSIEIMSRFYTHFYNSMKRWKEQLGCTPAATQPDVFSRLCERLIRRRPFLWIPDELPYTRTDLVVCGHFYSFDHVVKTDPMEKFSFANSPVKVLSLFYYRVVDIFARSMYCYACQAREGMFGVLGTPVGEPLRGPELRSMSMLRESMTHQEGDDCRRQVGIGTYDLLSLGQQICQCRDSSIGSLIP